MTKEQKADRWHVDAGDEWRQPRVLDWSGRVVAVLPEESDRAHLICAAPDMCEAIKESLDILNSLIDSIKRHGNYSPESTCTFIDQAGGSLREALAKAKGRPTPVAGREG